MTQEKTQAAVLLAISVLSFLTGCSSESSSAGRECETKKWHISDFAIYQEGSGWSGWFSLADDYGECMVKRVKYRIFYWYNPYAGPPMLSGAITDYRYPVFARLKVGLGSFQREVLGVHIKYFQIDSFICSYGLCYAPIELVVKEFADPPDVEMRYEHYSSSEIWLDSVKTTVYRR